MPPEFLNSREDVLALWAIFIVGSATYKDPGVVGGGLAAALVAMLHPKLVLLYGSALAYCAALVYGAHEIGIWNGSALKPTLYWFVGTGVVLIAEAVTRADPRDREFIRRVLKRVLGITLVIEFAVNVYVTPFVVELLAISIVMLFSMVQVVLEHDPSADVRVRKFVDGVLITIGLFYLSYFFVSALTDLGGLATRDRAIEFLVGPLLPLALIPFVYGVAWLSRHERDRGRKRWQPDQTPRHYAGNARRGSATPLLHVPRRAQLPETKSPRLQGLSDGAYRDRTDDLGLANAVVA